jgi:hypothetical protein
MSLWNTKPKGLKTVTLREYNPQPGESIVKFYEETEGNKETYGNDGWLIISLEQEGCVVARYRSNGAQPHKHLVLWTQLVKPRD